MDQVGTELGQAESRFRAAQTTGAGIQVFQKCRNGKLPETRGDAGIIDSSRRKGSSALGRIGKPGSQAYPNSPREQNNHVSGPEKRASYTFSGEEFESHWY
jgi:hypothetical protein